MENPAGRTTWKPWKMATVGIAAAITTALVTGLVVANWAGTSGRGLETLKSAPAVSSGTTENETGVRSNRAVSRRNGTTDVLEKAVIGGARGAGGGTPADREAANGGIVGAATGTPSGLHDK